jgi:hypothetical protein
MWSHNSCRLSMARLTQAQACRNEARQSTLGFHTGQHSAQGCCARRNQRTPAHGSACMRMLKESQGHNPHDGYASSSSTYRPSWAVFKRGRQPRQHVVQGQQGHNHARAHRAKACTGQGVHMRGGFWQSSCQVATNGTRRPYEGRILAKQLQSGDKHKVKLSQPHCSREHTCKSEN